MKHLAQGSLVAVSFIAALLAHCYPTEAAQVMESVGLGFVVWCVLRVIGWFFDV